MTQPNLEFSKSEANPTAQPTVDRASDHVSEPTWYVMDGVPGQGPRPDYLPEKFKSMEAAVKSRNELEKMLGATKGAPDEYDFGEYKDTLDLNNKNLQEFVVFAKENRISQDAFGKIVESFVKYGEDYIPKLDHEIAKLGPDGGRKFETVKTWAQNTFSKNALEKLERIIPNAPADVIELLDEMRQFQYHNNSKSQPPGNAQPTQTFKPITVKEVQDEMYMNRDRYANDQKYRDEITKKFEQAVG